MAIFATIGAKALYFLFIWLASAAAAGWLAERKGYGERLGLTFGLILSAAGLLIMLILPARPGSPWKVDGAIPRRRKPVAAADAPVLKLPDGADGRGAGGA